MEKEKKFIALYGELNSPEDFLTVPFEILEYRRELNITASEFTFICEIFHLTSKDLNEIKDKDITENRISFFRQRKSLKSKGYLKTKILNGNKKCGTIYDFTELKKIIDKLKKSKQKSVSQLSKKKSIKEKDKVKILKENEEDVFIKKYSKLYLKLLNSDIGNNEKIKNNLRKYLIPYFKNRKNPLDKALNIAEKYFLEIPNEKRNYLKLQDCVKNALINKVEKPHTEENKLKNTKSIPNGIDNLNKLLKVIEKKGDINETYKTITNTA